jgi:YesN/AraC family two-component response regulator
MKKASILICDDEMGIRESLKLILERDYALDYVTHGKEAVEYVKKHQPDLVIMDIKMPHMNGLDALRRIRRARPRVRILMITGYESSDVAAQAIQFGANDYLTKPFEREKVWEKVEALLSQPGKK